jgi:hypothetical protein
MSIWQANLGPQFDKSKTSFLTPQIIKPNMKLQCEEEKMRLQLARQFGIWI